ncbi:MAG: alpha-mannosidase [Anaerolineae bacterium]
MPDFALNTRNRLEGAQEAIEAAIYTPIADLSIAAYRTREPVPFAERTRGEKLSLRPGDSWGGLFDCAWFHFTGEVPASAKGRCVVLLLDVNGEMCVVDAQGVPVRGLTNASSTYDYSLGRPGKRVVPVAASALGGETIDLWADAGCNDLFGELKEQGTVKEACIALCHQDVRALFYDFEVLLDLLRVLPPDSARARQVLDALHRVRWLVAAGCSDEVAQQARAVLAPHLARRGGDPALRISAVGHAHMDLAWLWPIRETRRKGARTFATALANMERYPAYVFGASQPQLFQWLKEDHPTLYTEVKRRVAEGRLEPQGAMWVEADTNLTGGEALARQLLYGKRFFMSEFGIEVRHLWLPDVFGYSAALPQLLRRAGVDYFMTQKISWNQVNRFPHQSFHWQGIDGSSVLAHMLPEETYNSPALPRSLAKVESNYRDKAISDRCLLLFGIGDGGGGPGEEHLERLQRLADLAPLPPVQQERAASFFEAWRRDAARFPTWVGELYLEKHTGTLTTQARNKWHNRRLEEALRALELAALLAGGEYPAARLGVLWREALLYQFHDILPGSSIKRVYDECLARYAAMLAEARSLIEYYLKTIAQRMDAQAMRAPMLWFNPLSWPRTAWAPAGSGWRRVTVPALGYCLADMALTEDVPAVHASTEILENDLLRVTLAKDGAIVSIYDKEAGREVLPAGQQGNRLAVYADPGDAWDFPLDYRQQAPRYMALISSEPRVEGPKAILRQTYRYGHSQLVQEVCLTAGSRVLEFDSHLTWREPATMLRTSFPVAVHAQEATCQIQFGSIRRPTHSNTTWDLAKDEVAAHGYVDLSQRDWGVALLNDSKYGHRVKDNVLDLALLRSAPYPGPRLVRDEDVAPGTPHDGYTDQAEHVFRYGLYPHRGDHVQGGVIRAAYEFNQPLLSVAVEGEREHAVPGIETPRFARSDMERGSDAEGRSDVGCAVSASLVEVEAAEVIVEATKQAEEGEALILRLYEATGSSVRTRMRLGVPARTVQEADLLERPLRALPLEGDSVALEFSPFEIKTLRVAR